MALSVDDPLDEQSFRDVMGQFATGVVLLTARTDAGAVGMAINSFTSLSLRPPLVTFGAASSSTTWPTLRTANSFAVSILGANHRDLCRVFATKGIDRFAGRSWSTSPAGHPIVDDALGWLECQIASVHAGGDHDLVIAHAMRWSGVHGAPLVFHSGEFHRGLIKDPAKGDE